MINTNLTTKSLVQKIYNGKAKQQKSLRVYEVLGAASQIELLKTRLKNRTSVSI